jgi:DNA-directed RNA polymerase
MVVVAARKAMTWLQSVARIANQPFTWTTPSGFPVVQGYRQFKDRRVKTIMGDAFVFLSFKETTDKLDRVKQALAVSPNFVHSMDASAMMETVRLCRTNDVQSFAMIHDSYGTVAADTETMAMSLRMAFVDMYRTDVLQKFLVTVAADLTDEVAAQLPPVPPKGSLDLDQVLASPFFFS